MINLETERLVLRNFVTEDWKDLAELGIRYEETELAKYDEGPWPDDPEVYKEIVLDMSKKDDFIAVALKENSKVIGLIFKPLREEGRYDFGYNFHVEFQGKGYATESCKAIITYMFKDLEAKEITAGTAKVNNKSTRLLEKLGFKFVREKKIAFRKDDNGKPIEFTGVDYILKTNTK